MSEQTLKDKCSIKWPHLPKINIKDLLRRTDECHEEAKKVIEKATLNGDDHWMIKENPHK